MSMHTTVSIITLGCRVNQYESDAIGEKLQEMGFTLVQPGEKADFTIVNTCTVTAESDRKSRQMIRRAAGEGSMVLVTGCFSQVSGNEVAQIPGVAYVCGNAEKSALPQIVLSLAEGKRQEVTGVTDVQHAEYDPLFRSTTRRYRTFIKIEDGCENHCAYCIIPQARGRVRSRDRDSILTEAAVLARVGSPEVILTGIETASYGMENTGAGRLPYGMALASLLADVDAVPGIERIGLGSLEPSVMSPAFVEKIADLHHLLPHFHLSIQSGSTSVLRRMRRRYTAEMALAAIERLRNAIPDVTFSADVIVGFPGETEAEVQETMDFVEAARFLHLHLFPYSIRSGTEAAEMPEQIPMAQKKERLKALEAVQSAIRHTLLNEYVAAHWDTPAYVLVEQEKDGVAVGHTEHFVETHIRAASDRVGQIVPVLLTETDGELCYAVVGD